MTNPTEEALKRQDELGSQFTDRFWDRHSKDLRTLLTAYRAQAALVEEREVQWRKANDIAEEWRRTSDAVANKNVALQSDNDTLRSELSRLTALVEGLMEAAAPICDIDKVASSAVPPDAVVDVTYTHANGKKYGIVQSRMSWFRALAEALIRARAK